jgi:hypothetical protein
MWYSFSSMITYLAPFWMASLANLFPLKFGPFRAKNKQPSEMFLVSGVIFWWHSRKAL